MHRGPLVDILRQLAITDVQKTSHKLSSKQKSDVYCTIVQPAEKCTISESHESFN
jgi:hypothetical protein